MKGIVFNGVGEPLTWAELERPSTDAPQVKVEIKAAALNHRDVWITKGLYPGITTPCILGSDGAGVFADRDVIINPNINWGDDERFPSKAYQILGMPSYGTFADQVWVTEDRLHDKPEHLTWEEAAALPLAGLTAYRALFTKGQIQAGQKVLVTGAGGGVALIAIQLAIAAQADVYVTSGHDTKIDKVKSLGAKGGINYRSEDWGKALKAMVPAGFDLIIDSAGGPSFNTLIKITAPGGRIVTYGGSLGAAPKFSPQSIFWKQISIHGTSMGSDTEFAAMIEFVKLHQIHPVVDSSFPFSAAEPAFTKMDQGLQFGKLVLVH